MRIVKLLVAALLLPCLASAQTLNAGISQPYLNITAPNQIDGVSINPNTAGAGNFTTVTASGAATLSGGGTLTGSFTGGTLVNTAITGPAPTACGATCTVSVTKAGGTYLLNTAAGSVATLPGATGTGNVYKLVVSVAVSSNANKILTNPITDTIIGTAIGENAGTAKVFVGNASTYHSIQMPFAGTQPSGGFIGDSVTCTDVASTIWKCDVNYQAGTTPTTPYSAATS